MTKKICSLLTLFVLFFAMFIGLGTSNYSVIKAAGDQASVEADFEAIDKSFPETAYISFPVTYKSVFGNEITWFVEEGQSFVVHDLVAQWMVVTRPTLQDEEVDVTVVIKGEDNASKTHTFKLKVPAGTTTVPSYDIEYLNEDGSDFVFTEEVKRTYDLGEASFDLPVPTKAGYTFDGWYDGETKVERILVGSMKDYSLKAKWTLITYALTDEGVTLSNDELTYNASEQKPTVTVKYGETTLTEGTDYTVEYDEDVINQGIKSVVVTGKGIYTGTITKTYTIKKADLVLEAKAGKEAVYGDNLPTWSIADFTATYQGNDTSEVLNGELIVSYNVDAPKNVGEYIVSFSGIEADNYNVTINKSTLNITKKELVLSTEEKVINFGAELPTWELSGVFAYEENVSALGGNLVVTYKDSQDEVVTPSVIGTYTVSFSGYTSDNYIISYTPTTLTIADAKVMFVVSDTETTYNGDKQMFTVVVKKTEGNQEVIENANVTYICNDKAFDGATDANTYSVNISFSDPELGAISNEVSFVINAREITLTANVSESVYGEAVKTPSYVVTSGEILEKDLEGLAIEVNVNDITDLTIPGTYKDKVSVSFTENTNYNITPVANDYTVTKRTVKVAADDKSSDYSDEIANLTYQFVTEEGFYSVLESDLAELQALISILTDATNESNVGTYDITFTINESGKYLVEVENGAYVITQKSIDAAEILLSGSDFNVKAGTDKPSLTLKLGETVIDASLYDVAYTNTTMGENAIQTATVTVTIKEGGNYTGTVSKNYQLTSEGMAKIDADLIKAEYQQILTGSFETLDVNQLDVQGTNGSAINWMSDNTAVSVDSEGYVTIVRPVGSDAEVKLTAMIVYGNGSSVASCEFEFTVLGEYTLTNQDSSVVIEGIASTYELNAVEVTYDENSTFAVFDNEEYVVGYDISFNLGDEENVQPATTVTVKIEIPEEYLNDETLKVYHVNSDDSLTEIEYNIVGSYAVFEANEFSPYIITVKATYSVSADCINEQGSVSLSDDTVKALETVILTVEPKEGYKVSSVLVNGEVVELNDTNVYELTITKDTVVLVEFIEDKQQGGEVETTEVVFEFGENGTATHKDGSTDKAEYAETVGNYTLNITGGSKVYPNSYDAKGNSALKLGSSSAAGTFTFTVPDDVNKVIIAVAGYKANKAQIQINNGNAQEISTLSNDGDYTKVEIDTSSTKTITFTTVSDGLRAMLDSITYVIIGGSESETPNPEPDEKTDAEKIELDLSALSIVNTLAIGTDSISLPETGTNGSTITWTSSNTDVIGNDGRIVVRPVGENVTVTFTATLTLGEENREQTFDVVIEATPAPIEAAVFTLVEDISQLAVGDQIIIVGTNTTDSNSYALSTDQKTNNRGQVEIKIDNKTITVTSADVQIITVEAGTKDNTFAFNVGNGYLYAASSSNNYLKTQTNLSDNSSWSVAIAVDGTATIKAQGTYTRNWLRYNKSSGLFACYSSGQDDVVIYKLNGTH